MSSQIADKHSRSQVLAGFISELAQQSGLLTEFDERLWHSMVDFVTVYADNDVRFTFKDGREIQV